MNSKERLNRISICKKPDLFINHLASGVRNFLTPGIPILQNDITTQLLIALYLTAFDNA